MKLHSKLSATARAERSREATKQAIARELLYAGILARMWPAYVATGDPKRVNADFPYILCVDSPAGTLRWRLSEEEREMFDWIDVTDWNGEKPVDRTATLLALATDGSWTR